jgi:hypothetical protein
MYNGVDTETDTAGYLLESEPENWAAIVVAFAREIGAPREVYAILDTSLERVVKVFSKLLFF